jgi:hypothetical protein
MWGGGEGRYILREGRKCPSLVGSQAVPVRHSRKGISVLCIKQASIAATL